MMGWRTFHACGDSRRRETFRGFLVPNVGLSYIHYGVLKVYNRKIYGIVLISLLVGTYHFIACWLVRL